MVIFGNDYLLTFDKDNNVVTKKRIHRNIISVNYGQGGKEEIGAVHTHLAETGEFISATDICTLMLYEKFAKWKSHIVVSEHYISLWNCESDNLIILTRDAWDKINKDQKKRNSKD